MSSVQFIKSLIQDVPDFPKPGILFKDITPIFESPQAFQKLAKLFAESLPPGTTKVLGVESRGFILASALAQHKDVGMVLVRKAGKLPRKTYSENYALEYGQDCLQIHEDALTSEDKVVIVDDVLATGGTAAAVERLAEKTGATVLGSRFMMEIPSLKGRSQLRYPLEILL